MKWRKKAAARHPEGWRFQSEAGKESRAQSSRAAFNAFGVQSASRVQKVSTQRGPPTNGRGRPPCLPEQRVGLSASKSFKNLFQNLSKWAYDNSCLTSYALFEFLDVQEIRGAIIFTPILPNLQNIGKNYFKSGLTESSKVSLLTYPLFTLLKANSLMRPRFTNPIMSLLAVVALTKNLF